jgi:hypothetical protein
VAILPTVDEIVAQFKFTVLLMPNGPQKITGLPFDPTAFQTENSITDEEVKKLITSSTRSKPNKKKKLATTEVKKVSQSDHLISSRKQNFFDLAVLLNLG